MDTEKCQNIGSRDIEGLKIDVDTHAIQDRMRKLEERLADLERRAQRINTKAAKAIKRELKTA